MAAVGTLGPTARRVASERGAGFARRVGGSAWRVVVLALCGLLAGPACDSAAPSPGSTLIGCEQADERLVLTSDTHLDPACVYTEGFDIATSGVTLDCRGALVHGAFDSGRRGIAIEAPEASDLVDVTVRHCRVEGFLNSVWISRAGFRSFERGAEHLHETRNIRVERSWLEGSRGVGLFVDAYVSDVTVRDNVILGAGSAGIYLETGSRRNRIEGNWILANGFRENGPGGQPFPLAGIDFWFWGVGREGIAVDGSYENLIVGNRLSGNSAGGIFLYKNCGEFPDRPRYFERRTPSDDNRIEANAFGGGRNGVWVGSRMGENTYPMDCTDPAYLEGPLQRVVLDFAAGNVVRGNVFHDVTHAIRVEDDRTRVEGNRFVAGSPDHHAVIVGTPHRTDVLDRPVRGTVIRGNVAEIAGNESPYRWVHGHEDTEFAENRALGQNAPFCEGEPVPRQPLIFMTAFAPASPGGSPPATTPDLTVPTLAALAGCPGSTARPIRSSAD